MANNIRVTVKESGSDINLSLNESGNPINYSIIENAVAASLYGLDDVDFTSLSDNQIIQYNSTSGKWENVTLDIPDTATWGNIIGTLSDQTDLQAELDLKTNEVSFQTHVTDATIHYPQSSISITESQISDLDKYSQSEVDTLLALKTDLTTFNSHTNDSDIHFEQGDINITASQVSDFDTEVSNNSSVVLNTTHRTSDGTDHTYIDQDLRVSASPVFEYLSSNTSFNFPNGGGIRRNGTNRFGLWSDNTAMYGPSGATSLKIRDNGIELNGDLIQNLNLDGNYLENAKLWYDFYDGSYRPGLIQPAYTDTLYYATKRGITVTSNRGLAEGNLDNLFTLSNTRTRWNSVTSSNPVELEIEYTGNGPYIGKIDIAHSWRDSMMIDYVIEIYEDANDDNTYQWTTIATVTGNTEYLISHNIDKWRTKKIKITVTDAGEGSEAGMLSIGTIQATSAVHGKGTGHLAEVGPNTFYGNQTINGTLDVTGNVSTDGDITLANTGKITVADVRIGPDSIISTETCYITSDAGMNRHLALQTWNDGIETTKIDLVDNNSPGQHITMSIEDSEKLRIKSTGIDVSGNIEVDGTVDGIDINTDITANNAKVTNATHTGEVTGSDALTVNKTAISNKTDTVITADDTILFGDASDSNNLKKDTVQGILDLVPPNINTDDVSITYDGDFVDTITIGTRVITYTNDGSKYTSWTDTDNTWTPTYTDERLTSITVT